MTKRQMGMCNRRVFTLNYQLFLKTESSTQPFNGLRRIVVKQARRDRWGWHF